MPNRESLDSGHCRLVSLVLRNFVRLPLGCIEASCFQESFHSNFAGFFEIYKTIQFEKCYTFFTLLPFEFQPHTLKQLFTQLVSRIFGISGSLEVFTKFVIFPPNWIRILMRMCRILPKIQMLMMRAKERKDYCQMRST